jgi:hypothetical protein
MNHQRGDAERKLMEQYEHLIREKNDVDAQLSEAKSMIHNSQVQYNHTGKGAHPDQYRRWSNDILRLKRRSQTLQTELGSVRQRLKTLKSERLTQAELFMEVARERLSEELFAEIYDEAYTRRDF